MAEANMESESGYREPQVKTFFRILGAANYYQTRKLLKQYAAKYPRFMYKFRRLQSTEDMNHLREIIVRSELWLSSPKAFNDPFDMSIKFVFDATIKEKRMRFTKVLKAEGKKFHEIERLLPKLIRNANAENLNPRLRKTVDETGVCSFAGDPRNILMWSHYASNHEGLCLVFEVARDPKTFLDALPVEYSLDYPVVNWVKDFDEGGPLTIVLRKHEGWKYEKERRIVKFKKANTHIKFSPAALWAIITGCRVKEGTLGNLKNLLAERTAAQMPPITVYRCCQHNSRYKLVISKSSKPKRMRRNKQVQNGQITKRNAEGKFERAARLCFQVVLWVGILSVSVLWKSLQQSVRWNRQ